jgi:hypothetical protein
MSYVFESILSYICQNFPSKMSQKWGIGQLIFGCIVAQEEPKRNVDTMVKRKPGTKLIIITEFVPAIDLEERLRRCLEILLRSGKGGEPADIKEQSADNTHNHKD